MQEAYRVIEWTVGCKTATNLVADLKSEKNESRYLNIKF